MIPLSQLTLALMDGEPIEHYQECLQTNYHCYMSLTDEGYYLVTFPAGTFEEKSAASHARYREESVITLPDGLTLKKVILWPCNSPGCTHVRVLLPNEPEEKPMKRAVRYGTR